MKSLASDIILLRHNFLSPVCCGIGAATRTSRQGFDERVDQAHAHGCDRVRNVALRPQGGIPWVYNGWVKQASGAAWRDEVVRGESVSYTHLTLPTKRIV